MKTAGSAFLRMVMSRAARLYLLDELLQVLVKKYLGQ